MTAAPTIEDAFITKSGNSTWGEVYISNPTTAGMVKTTLHNYVSSICQTELDAVNICVPITQTSYISNLRFRVALAYNVTPLSFACVKTYVCSSGDNCGTDSCTTYNTSAYNTKSNLQLYDMILVSPNPVTAMTSTVSSGNAVIKFTPPSNTFVQYYAITLLQGSNILTDGLWLKYNTSGGISVMNLTNGVQYTLRVFPISEDGLTGASNSINFTPVNPCTQPSCTFTIT